MSMASSTGNDSVVSVCQHAASMTVTRLSTPLSAECCLAHEARCGSASTAIPLARFPARSAHTTPMTAQGAQPAPTSTTR